MGVSVGIYSSEYEWGQMDICGDFSEYPLWYADYDGQANFDDFTPFGGWKAPYSKQFVGDQTLCGASVDGDWIP